MPIWEEMLTSTKLWIFNQIYEFFILEIFVSFFKGFQIMKNIPMACMKACMCTQRHAVTHEGMCIHACAFYN